MIGAVEQAVIARLKGAFDTFDVEAFPDDPTSYDFTACVRTLLVNYNGSTYGTGSKSLSPFSVERESRIVVTILVRQLRGHDGLVAVAEDVIRCLFGWRPARLVDDVEQPLGGSAFVPIEDKHIGHEDGVWRWDVPFRTTGVVVASQAELTGPLFKRAIAEREGGCT